MKSLFLPLIAAALISTASFGVAAETAPKSVIHVVTVSWKKDATPEQIKAALDGAHKLPAAHPGIVRVWTRTIKAQGEHKNVIAMEFASEEALASYHKSPAQTEWYKSYLPVRERSTTYDVSN